MSTTRNRAAYNRALKMAREAYWSKSAADPNFTLSWNEFRPQFITQAMANITVKPRGPKPGENQTDRQRYQQVYQKARRRANEYFHKSTKLQSQFMEFSAYWAEHKNTWLPEGFLKPKADPLVAKRATDAKDTRTAYRVVYNHYRRCWDGNIAGCCERFGTWARYWEFVKANGFVPGEGQAIPEEHIVTYHEGTRYSDLDGGQYFVRIPEQWQAKPPITRAVAVTLDTDTHQPDEGWIQLE